MIKKPLNLQILFLNSKECLLIGFYTKMDLYSQPTYPNTSNFYINQKFIHWATRGRLNNHCNNKGLLEEWRRFLHTYAILARSAIFDCIRIT